MNKKRLLGIDYGRARIGVAISDESKLISRPLCTLDNNKTFETLLKKEMQPYQIEAVVMGLPLLMNGKESPMTAEVKQFGEYLKKILEISVIFWDERLTSLQVERSMRDAGIKRKKRAASSDTMAAALILQSYLDSKNIASQPHFS